MAIRRTIRDVADRAGVSLGTVSNVLNRPDLVAEETRRRVLEAIDETGFIRNAFAHQLRAGRSLAVGLIVPDVSNPFWVEIARGVEEAANEAGLAVILCNTDQRVEREERHLRILEEQRVAGVLMSPLHETSRVVERLRDHNVAVVLLDRAGKKGEQCSVAVNDVKGGRLAGEHLLAGGHHELVMLNGPKSLQQCRDRRRGFFNVVRRHDGGSTQAREVVVESLTVKAGMEATHEVLGSRRRRRATGVFCANDLLALGLLRGVLSQGLRVPGDVAIVGYDDVDYVSSATVPLTSVRQPTFEIGRTGMQLLLEELRDRDQHLHQTVMFSPELVVRASTQGMQEAMPELRVP